MRGGLNGELIHFFFSVVLFKLTYQSRSHPAPISHFDARGPKWWAHSFFFLLCSLSLYTTTQVTQSSLYFSLFNPVPGQCQALFTRLPKTDSERYDPALVQAVHPTNWSDSAAAADQPSNISYPLFWHVTSTIQHQKVFLFFFFKSFLKP